MPDADTAQRPKLRRGQLVRVYMDLVTRKDLEGIGRLIRRDGLNGTLRSIGFERWRLRLVQVESRGRMLPVPDDDPTVLRLVHPDDLVPPDPEPER